VNMNDFARRVTLREGKKKSVSIAQVKEVVRIVMAELSVLPSEVILRTVRRIGRQQPKAGG